MRHKLAAQSANVANVANAANAANSNGVGLGPGGPGTGRAAGDASDAAPLLTNAELVQLRIRVIALENLVITLLAGATEGQLALAFEMADYISPRPGFTPHRLTLHAAAEMRSLVDRAEQFRNASPS